MEINTVPKLKFKKSEDSVYTKIPALNFPVDDQKRTYLVQDVTYYSKTALFDPFYDWRKNNEDCTGSFNETGAWKPSGLTTKMPAFDQDDKKMKKVEETFSTAIFQESIFGIQWKETKGDWGRFPQYYLTVNGGDPVSVPEKDVPAELTSSEFTLAEKGEPYTSPDSGAWANPGPASGPEKVTLADGSEVTYAWYRFVDQPSLQQFNWSAEQKEKLQALVEKIQTEWKTDKDYMKPQSTGELVTFDQALLVNPPKGYEVGYVPIVIGQK